MMLRWLPLLLPLGGCTAASDPARHNGSGGIVSTNPCADAILTEIAPPPRIAAISHYSRDPRASSIDPALARRFAVTAGTAEEVIALQPELVIFGSFEPATARAAYARAGIRTLAIDVPATIDEAKAQVRTIAAAIGEEARGAALTARIDAAAAASTAPAGPPVPALLLHGGGLVSGAGTLDDAMLAHTGFRNAAADYGLAFTGYIPLETLAASPPRVILAPPAARGGDEGRLAAMRARILARSGTTTEIEYPERLAWCAGPVVPAALARLAAIRRTVNP